MPQNKPDLTDFTAWLISQGKSPSTAKVYTSNVRIILRDAAGDWTDASFVEGFFAVLQQESPGIYAARLSAYNAWADYSVSVLGRPVVRPPSKRGDNEPAPELPPEVCEAIRTLRHQCSISFQRLAFMTWEDVEFLPGARGDYYHVRDPTMKGVSFKADADAIDVLMDWSDPVHVGLPLVPREPGSEQPYPVKGLQREAARGQETLRERVARLREEERREQEDEGLVTPHNYMSRYLPQEETADTVERRLGLAPRNSKSRNSKSRNSKSRNSKSRNSNESPRPEGAGVGSGLRASDEAGGLWGEPIVASRDLSPKEPDPHRARAAESSGLRPASRSLQPATTRPTTTQPTPTPAPFSVPLPPYGSPVSDIERAAALLNVDPAKLQALVSLLKPEAESTERSRPESRAVRAIAVEEEEEPARIQEKPPIVGDDGLLYDPNDPYYGE